MTALWASDADCKPHGPLVRPSPIRGRGLSRNNLYVFLKSEARISKSETNTNHLNSNVPNAKGTYNIVIILGFEQRVLNLFRDLLFAFRDLAPLKRTSYFLPPIKCLVIAVGVCGLCRLAQNRRLAPCRSVQFVGVSPHCLRLLKHPY